MRGMASLVLVMLISISLDSYSIDLDTLCLLMWSDYMPIINYHLVQVIGTIKAICVKVL